MPKLYLRGKPLGVFNCILFDKDGTLVNSEEHLLKLASLRVRETVKIFNEKELAKTKIQELEKFLKKIYGMKNKKLDSTGSIAIASREQNLISTATIFSLTGLNWSQSIEIANNVFQEVDQLIYSKEECRVNRPILPGALKALQGLKKVGFNLGIISNDSKTGIDHFLIENHLEDIFNYCWSCEDSPPKSNPASINKLCKILQVKNSECILISDADTDFLIGKKNNIQLLLGFTGGWSTEPKLYEHDHLIHHWDEISYQ